MASAPSQPRSGARAPEAGFVAGMAAGVARIIVGHPFDTIKVLTQTGQFGGISTLLKPGCLGSVARLYRGIGPPMLTVCVTTGASFGVYEAARLAWRPLGLPAHAEIFLAGTTSGVVLSIPFCPLANVRVLQQTQAQKRSIFGWLRELHQLRGARAWFRGLVPNLVQNGVGRGFYMTTFHLVKEAEDATGLLSSESYSGKLLAASCAGISGWVFTYPFDVIRSNIIRDWQCQRFSGAVLPALLQLFRDGGLPRLYTGLGYTVVRAAPVAAVTLTTYDKTKAAVHRFADSANVDYDPLDHLAGALASPRFLDVVHHLEHEMEDVDHVIDDVDVDC